MTVECDDVELAAACVIVAIEDLESESREVLCGELLAAAAEPVARIRAHGRRCLANVFTIAGRLRVIVSRMGHA